MERGDGGPNKKLVTAADFQSVEAWQAYTKSMENARYERRVAKRKAEQQIKFAAYNERVAQHQALLLGDEATHAEASTGDEDLDATVQYFKETMRRLARFRTVEGLGDYIS